ncbi:MAG: hypothetical protein F4X02_01740 [Chloroflexi bacterium]|nr:hypothetical protein [Chloroflexota bacterium]
MRSLPGLFVTLLLLGFFALAQPATADDCDSWGRLIQVGEQPGDNFCLTRVGSGGSTTKSLEDKYDFDYFVFYLGYNDETNINQEFRVALTNTNLSRPHIAVGTFYDDPQAYGGQSGAEAWYNVYSADLGGMTLDEFRGMVSLGPNLQHDGVYDYVNGAVVVVTPSSDAAKRQMFYSVPVGTVLAENSREDDPNTAHSEKYEFFFTPPDRGAYIIVVSNYSRSRRGGRLTGSYTISVSSN